MCSSDLDIWSCDLTHKDWNVAIPQCLESLKRKPNVYRRTYVMNMSLEAIKNEVGVPYYAPCGGFSDPLNMTIQGFTTYRLVVASAWNDGWSNAVGFPACLPAVLSVGASYDVSGQQWSFFPTQDAPNTANCTETATLDYLTCYTNRAYFLGLVAPGTVVYTPHNPNFNGTSAAAPIVTGVAALMFSANPSLTPDQVRTILKQTGDPAYDPVNNTYFPRINAYKAVSAVLPAPPPPAPAPAPVPPGSRNFSLALHAAWNMISSPVGSVPLSSLQGNCSVTSGPWAWNGTHYQLADIINPTHGYWVRVDNPCTIQAVGNDTSDILGLVSGWNMISSSGSWNQLVAKMKGNCSLLSGPWWWDGTQFQLVPPDIPLDAFKGYWVKVGGSCIVVSQLLHNSWDGSPLPPGPPMKSHGLFTGLLRLLGISQQTAMSISRGSPLALQEIQVNSVVSGRIELRLKGTGIIRSELRLYSLSGQLIAESQVTGSKLSIVVLDRDGRPLANGVYLYIVTVRGASGQTMTSEPKKLVLLR